MYILYNNGGEKMGGRKKIVREKWVIGRYTFFIFYYRFCVILLRCFAFPCKTVVWQTLPVTSYMSTLLFLPGFSHILSFYPAIILLLGSFPYFSSLISWENISILRFVILVANSYKFSHAKMYNFKKEASHPTPPLNPMSLVMSN